MIRRCAWLYAVSYLAAAIPIDHLNVSLANSPPLVTGSSLSSLLPVNVSSLNSIAEYDLSNADAVPSLLAEPADDGLVSDGVFELLSNKSVVYVLNQMVSL